MKTNNRGAAQLQIQCSHNMGKFTLSYFFEARYSVQWGSLEAIHAWYRTTPQISELEYHRL